MNGFNGKRRVSGFTLTELMVVILVVAILAAIATPSMTEMIQRNRIDAYSNELISALSLARSEAIKRGETALVKNQDNAPLYRGWRVEAATFSAPNTPLVVQEQIGMKNTVFCGNACEGDDKGGKDEPTSISFNSRGNLVAPAKEVKMVLIPGNCSPKKLVGKAIWISAVGRISSKRVPCPG